MPELPIYGPDGQLAPLAGLRITSAMFFPADVLLRGKFEREAVQAVDPTTSTEGEDPAVSAAAASGHYLKDFMQGHQRDIEVRAIVSGSWMRYRLHASEADPALNSDGRAWHQCREILVALRNEGHGSSRRATDDRTLRKLRDDFLPVAHLWAAYLLVVRPLVVARGVVMLAPSDLLSFVSIAERFRRAAWDGGLYPERLREGELWIAPDRGVFPITAPLNFDSGLTDWTATVQGRYRSRTTRERGRERKKRV